MVSAKEEPDCSIPPAVDGLLRVHKQVVNVDPHPADSASGAGRPVVTRLLVADTQAGSLIGKQGSTIKSFQDATGCNIRILGSGALTTIVNYIGKCCLFVNEHIFLFNIFSLQVFLLCRWRIFPNCIFFLEKIFPSCIESLSLHMLSVPLNLPPLRCTIFCTAILITYLISWLCFLSSNALIFCKHIFENHDL